MHKPIRVLLLTQWFDPEPTFKGMVFARELVAQGFEVEVVTGFPNYPGGKVYPGYKIKWWQREVVDGVKITRLPLFPSHDQSVIKRVLNYASFAASSLFYCLFFAQRANVMYAYHPPLTVGITASFVRIFRRIPVVYDIQDMWPDTLRATGMLNSSLALNVVTAICNWVYRQMDHIVVLSPGFKQLLLQRGVSSDKLSVIYNWADEGSLAAPKGEGVVFADPGKFHILFAGNLGKAQALESVLEAAELLKRRGSRVCWMMLGRGLEVERLKAEASRRELTNIVFLPAVPMDEVGAYLQAADALLVHLRKDPLFQITIPSKTQAYMAAGKPLLMAVDGDAARLVREANCGSIANSEDAEDLAQVAASLSNMTDEELHFRGENARRYYKRYLSLGVGVRRFGELFTQLGSKP